VDRCLRRDEIGVCVLGAVDGQVVPAADLGDQRLVATGSHMADAVAYRAEALDNGAGRGAGTFGGVERFSEGGYDLADGHPCALPSRAASVGSQPRTGTGVKSDDGAVVERHRSATDRLLAPFTAVGGCGRGRG
jgi:hypothetical protein